MSWDSGISSEGCKFYNSGRHCKLEFKGGCPLHDPNLRNEALKKMRFDASRAKLQQQYAFDKSTSKPSTDQKNSGPQHPVCRYFVNGGCKLENCRFLHDESAHSAAEQRKMGKTAKQLKASMTKESLKQDPNSLQIPFVQGTPDSITSGPSSNAVAPAQATDQLVKVVNSKATVCNPKKNKSKQGNPKPQDINTKSKPRKKQGSKKNNAKKDNTTPGVPKSVALPTKDNQPQQQHIWTEEVGDSWGRSKVVKPGAINSAANFPPLSAKSEKYPPTESYVPGWTKSMLDLSPKKPSQEYSVVVDRGLDSKHRNPKSPSTAIVPARTTALQVHNKPSSTLATTVASRATIQVVKLTTKSWDDHGEQSWALTNLRRTTINKILAHIENGEIPISFFQTIPEMAPPGTSFPLFAVLPTELRIQIWKYVIDGERYEARIKIHYEVEFGHYTRCKFMPQNCAPRLLHVNHEARHLAQQHFDVTFGTCHHRSLTYFNYKTDRLFIHTRGAGELPLFVNNLIKFDRNRIERLCLPLRDFVTNPDSPILAKAVSKFSGLKTLFLVVGDGREDSKWGENPEPHARSIQKFISPFWRKANGTPMPYVIVHVISALQAHLYKIDGLCWA